MSLDEPGLPYFNSHSFKRDQPFTGARKTSAGLYRMFPITLDSPHEPWCMHFEWGPCDCGPREGEVFVEPPLEQAVTAVEWDRPVRSGRD